jgi:hypothetical protein
MANKPKSVYLTERSMSALRPDDSLSARVNQIIDRYLEAVMRDRDNVRAKFTAQEWVQLSGLLDWFDDRALAAEARISALLAFSGNRALRRVVHDLTAGELVVLLELLESEALGEPPGTHSRETHHDAG